MKVKSAIWALLAGTALLFAVDFLMYDVIFKDMMSEMDKFFASVTYPEGQKPSQMWFIVYELSRAGIVGLVVFQKPLTGAAAFLWSFVVSVLLGICVDFWWVMMFNNPDMGVGMVVMDSLTGGIFGGLAGWIMGLVYSKTS